MTRQPRLDRSAVISRLREHAARVGAVSPASLAQQDRLVLRSLRQHFPSFEAACRAARVPMAGRRAVVDVVESALAATPTSGRTRRKQPESPAAAARAGATHPGTRRAGWSRQRVLDELRRLDRSGESTSWAELMQSGRGDLVGAAAAYAGGLTRARAEAGVQRPAPRSPVPQWTQATIVAAIRLRARNRQTLASSKAPQRFVAAARWHFGNWEAALAAAGVEPGAVRLRRAAYTKAEIIALVRQLAREGQVVRAATLKAQVKLDAVRRLFGSVAAAIRAAGAQVSAVHPNQKWTRERVLEELRLRAKRGETTLTPGLHRAARQHFGGAPAAREAAGIPAVLRAAWTKQALIRELRHRARRGDSGRTLWTACKRLFGSVAAARRAAGVPSTQRTQGMVAWSKPRLLAELRRRMRQRLQLSRGLSEGLRRQYGSLTAARAAAGVGAARGGAGDRTRAAAAKLRIRSPAWTPDRIRRALRAKTAGVADPAFVAACIEHFGSVTAARADAARGQRQRVWSKATVIRELRARAGRGLKGVGRLLREPAVRLFGSTEAALQAAAG